MSIKNRRAALESINNVVLPDDWSVPFSHGNWEKFFHHNESSLILRLSALGSSTGLVEVTAGGISITGHYKNVQMAVDHVIAWFKKPDPKESV